jgi:hypothetical protein
MPRIRYTCADAADATPAVANQDSITIKPSADARSMFMIALPLENGPLFLVRKPITADVTCESVDSRLGGAISAD